MKKAAVIFILLSFVLLCLPFASAASETIQLTPGSYVVKAFDLQQGDHLEGSFIVSPFYPYQSSLDNKNHTYVVSVDVQQPENVTVVDFPEVIDSQPYTFTFTANISGRYEVRFFCSDNYFPAYSIVPQATLNYTITSGSQPTAPPADSSPYGFSAMDYFLIAAVTVLFVGALLLVYLQSKRKKRLEGT